jgi:hypothetical protein
LRRQQLLGILWVGSQLSFQRLSQRQDQFWRIIIQMCLVMATSQQLEPKIMDQLTFLLEELPANHSASQDLEADWMMTVATWPLSFLSLLNERGPSGWFGRTSPVSCHRTEDGTLEPFLVAWSNAGMGSPTECLTLNTLEFHSAAAACSLSDVLEIGEVPQRFFLSATACRGILRRAEKRGKTLPEPLKVALLAVAEGRGLERTEMMALPAL